MWCWKKGGSVRTSSSSAIKVAPREGEVEVVGSSRAPLSGPSSSSLGNPTSKPQLKLEDVELKSGVSTRCC